MKETIALADDHVLLRKGLANLLQDFDYEVLFEADNGLEFITQMKKHPPPMVVLMDINMPEMDGYETTLWLKKNHPQVKVLALSMYDDEHSIIRMIKNGAKGYLLKDCDPVELKLAIHSLITKDYYHSELVTGKLIHTLNKYEGDTPGNMKDILKLNEKEIMFLKLACTEMTYKEIADQMCLSPRTIDGYRNELFERFNIKSRVGLVIFAIKQKFITV